MKTHVQIALLVLASLYGLWVVGFIAAPRQLHTLLSSAAYDPASLSLLTALLLALAASLLLAARNPLRDAVLSAATTALLVGAVIASMLLAGDAMVLSYATVTTMIVSLAVAAFLFLSQTETFARLESQVSKSARAHTPPKVATLTTKPASATAKKPGNKTSSKKKSATKKAKKSVAKKGAGKTSSSVKRKAARSK